ncbi:amino acid ABC transporter substrate-binding protein [Bosea sp. BIWAKO-01]|uniref:amino acid ABC transporter substrate-binding protein n=1 Tax=Bosea sp. BIWAKO-01 TaxID=506668 RepID=UPI0008533069|nr:amino acid ABC transporter substrate-binding protein [Bosea sp. BIWAKO-01]GAU84650.1 glutamate aspartate periplasmic binding protein precursor GltI [Bosea sp. BIWAKO-01]
MNARLTTALGFTLALAVSAQAGTLEKVRERGQLLCGVSPGVAGFSVPDEAGRWTGFDVDLCRAVAAATLGDASKVKFIPLSPKDRFVSLQSGEIDVLSRQATWTLSRDTQLGLRFAGINYYDGQGFMIRKSLNAGSAKELGGASVCVPTGTTTELNIADFFRANGMKYESVSFESGDQAAKAFESGRCDVFSNDVSALSAYRLKLVNPAEFVILPELISKEPLGPVVRQGDEAWNSIVRWSYFAMVAAEELGVSSANADQLAASGSPEVRRLLGSEGKFGEPMGLKNDWAMQIVKQVGNYGESHDRNVGAGSRLGIARGLNNLWSKGGLQYSPPVR